MTAARLPRRYTRSNESVPLVRTDRAESLAASPMVRHWRPLLDLSRADAVPLWVGNIPYLGERICAGPAGEPPGVLPSITPVAGLRNQVVLHAGLATWVCRSPAELPAGFQSPAWHRLTTMLADWEHGSGAADSVALTLLNLLSFPDVVVRVASGRDRLSDDAAYELARAHLRLNGKSAKALAIFDRLAGDSPVPAIRWAALSQSISARVRYHGELGGAAALAGTAVTVAAQHPPGRSFSDDVLLSRLLRAVALWRARADGPAAAGRLLDQASAYQAAAATRAGTAALRQLAAENERLLADAELKLLTSASAAHEPHVIAAQAAHLRQLDPWDPEALLAVADGYVAIGDLAAAAEALTMASDLGTMAGAVAAWRAGLLWKELSEPAKAASVFRRCLSLDPNAVEPRAELERAEARPHGAGRVG
jgi:tetratricopeptide (TPR) repeat protein